MDSRNSTLRSLGVLLCAFVVLARGGVAQDVDDVESQAATFAPDGFGVSLGFGWANVGGEWAQALDYGLDADVNLSYLFGSGIRIGIGAYYVSYNVQEEFGAEAVSNVQLQGLFGYSVLLGRVRPYGQVRLTYVRLRLEGQFGNDPSVPEGENTEPRRHGIGGIMLGGLEFLISRYVTLDANAWYGAFTTQEVDLTLISGPQLSKGQSWGIRIGIVVYTDP